MADEDGAAGRRSARSRRIVDPGEEIEQLEEEDEGRDQRPLGPALAAQADHLRDEVEIVGLRVGDEGGQVGRRVNDVGIGEEDMGRSGPAERIQSLLDCPELAAPADGRRHARDDRQPCRLAPGGGGRERGRPVGATVVDQDDPDLPRIVLGQERPDGGTDRGRLVAGRDDDGDGRTACRPSRRQHRPRLPEAAVAQDEVRPDHAGEQCQAGHHPILPVARSQATASLTAAPAGRGRIAELAPRLGRGKEHLLARHGELIAGHRRLPAGEAAQRLRQHGDRHQRPDRQAQPRRGAADEGSDHAQELPQRQVVSTQDVTLTTAPALQGPGHDLRPRRRHGRCSTRYRRKPGSGRRPRP